MSFVLVNADLRWGEFFSKGAGLRASTAIVHNNMHYIMHVVEIVVCP